MDDGLIQGKCESKPMMDWRALLLIVLGFSIATLLLLL